MTQSYTNETLTDQILALCEKLGGTFPYEDCYLLLKQIEEVKSLRGSKRYEDLISDLDGYLYLVGSHARGVQKLGDWPVSELTISQDLLKLSFYQTHRRYREIKWMINEINIPRLSSMLTASNELRAMLLKLISDRVEESRRVNTLRQEKLLHA